LFLVEFSARTKEETAEVVEPNLAELEGKALEFELLETEPFISLQAINGVQGFQTMRVMGYFGKKSLQLLVDFVDLKLARKLGCTLEPIHLQSVLVADGNALKCEYMCRKFTWRLQGTEFCADVLLIPLRNCDMVLRVQWLSTLGTIQWNFQTLQMEFSFNNKRGMSCGIARS